MDNISSILAIIFSNIINLIVAVKSLIKLIMKYHIKDKNKNKKE